MDAIFNKSPYVPLVNQIPAPIIKNPSPIPPKKEEKKQPVNLFPDFHLLEDQKNMENSPDRKTLIENATLKCIF